MTSAKRSLRVDGVDDRETGGGVFARDVEVRRMLRWGRRGRGVDGDEVVRVWAMRNIVSC